jgi:ABC-type uncharacterized transport system substrate-binding protein
MRRRNFIALLGGAAAWPLAARAQQRERMRRIGVMVGREDDPGTHTRLAALRQGLERLGWSEGRNLHIDYRFAPAGTHAQVLAMELISLQPDVILAQGTPNMALRQTSGAVPIVFLNVTDPIGLGFAASLSRPGGNLTGLLVFEASIAGKWLAMLKEMVPRLNRAALVINPRTAPYYEYYVRAAEASAPSLGLETTLVRTGNVAAEVEFAIQGVAQAPNSGLVVLPDTTNSVHRDHIVALAAQHRLPAVYTNRMFAVAGGLMSYGTDEIGIFGQAASYVDRILRGAKPADLPVQAPTKYETIVNIRAAKALFRDTAREPACVRGAVSAIL